MVSDVHKGLFLHPILLSWVLGSSDILADHSCITLFGTTSFSPHLGAVALHWPAHGGNVDGQRDPWLPVWGTQHC